MHVKFCRFTLIVTSDTLYIYFCFMKHESVVVNFLKKMSLSIESILAHVILWSGFDLNTYRPVHIGIQCVVHIGVLCIVVHFFLQIYFSSFTYCKFLGLLGYEKLYKAMRVKTNIVSKFYTYSC